MPLNIDSAFEELIPPLLEGELKNLEESILKEGCRDPILAWNDTIIDGHHRYKICTEHDIEFSVIQLDFDSKNEAMMWMVDNQLSRRNLNSASRGSLVLKKKEIVAALAKENMSAGGGDKVSGFDQMNKPAIATINTREVLAAEADVSTSTLSRVERVEKRGVEKLKKAYKKPKADISVSLANKICLLDEHEQEEVVDKIEKGQKSTEAYREVVTKNNPPQRDPMAANFQRLSDHCLAYSEGLQLWAEGTIVPQGRLEQINAQTLLDSAPNIISQFVRLGVDVEWCIGVARGEENGRIAQGSRQETEGERVQSGEIIDVIPD